MPPAAASRKLAGIEQALRFIDDVAPFNVVVVLRIEGDLPAARLRASLDELQHRHPMLQARILATNNEYSFHFDSPGPIPIEICEPSPADSWLAAAEEELHQRFNLVAGPLMRCRYLQNQWGGQLIIALHHTIIDGASAAHLLSELLSLCACQGARRRRRSSTRADSPPPHSTPPNTPARALYAPRRRSWRARWRTK